jgi:hypothetical protein
VIELNLSNLEVNIAEKRKKTFFCKSTQGVILRQFYVNSMSFYCGTKAHAVQTNIQFIN